MASLTLYNHALDEGCYKVRLALSMLALDYRTVAVDSFPGREETKPPLLAKNPAGRLPIIDDGSMTLSGAEAILAHLARTYDHSGRWLPIDGEAFAKVMQWLAYAAGELEATRAARRHALFDVPGDGRTLGAAARNVLRMMDDHMTARCLAGEEWFATSHATIADVALFPAFALSRDFGVDHDEYAALRRWARRFREVPGFITMPGVPDYH